MPLLFQEKSLVLQVQRFLRHAEADRGECILVGFSGGTDSTVLSLALSELGHAHVLAHLDHGLREESAQDARKAAAFAARVKVPFVSERVDVSGLATALGLGLEDAGRRARYAFLESVRARHGCRWIALGHHADDLVEDVLLRLIRGAGWPALGGMPAVDPRRHLLRPLLALSRHDIEAYLQRAGICPVADESNSARTFRRNRLRHDVIPRLRAENPALHRTVLRLHELASLDADYWESSLAPLVAQAAVHPASGAVRFDEAVLRPLHKALRLRLYTRLLALLPGAGQPRAETLFALDKALFESQRPKTFELPGGVRAILASGTVEFGMVLRTGK